MCCSLEFRQCIDELANTKWYWKIGMLAIFVGSVFYIIAFSTMYWSTLDNEQYALPNVTNVELDGHYGLWRGCSKLSTDGVVILERCKHMSNDKAYKPITKTMISIGLAVFVIATAGHTLARLLWCHYKLSISSGGLLILGALFALVGSIAYVAKSKDEDDRLSMGYSSYFAAISSVVVGFGAFLVTLESRNFTAKYDDLP